MDIMTLLNPPVPYRYWLVYYRFDDGRLMYFRGSKRNALFITNLKCGIDGGWTAEEDFARLFQYEPKINHQTVSKRINHVEAVDHINYRGFNGIVLTTHLILPRG